MSSPPNIWDIEVSLQLTFLQRRYWARLSAEGEAISSGTGMVRCGVNVLKLTYAKNIVRNFGAPLSDSTIRLPKRQGSWRKLTAQMAELLIA